MDAKKLDKAIEQKQIKRLEQDDWTSQTYAKVDKIHSMAIDVSNKSKDLYRKVDQYIDYCHEQDKKMAEKVAGDVERTLKKILDAMNSL